jgi:DNA-binding Lrp family transcriptional regulator
MAIITALNRHPHKGLMQRTTFDPVDRKLMNILQSDFPLVETPFRAVADSLGINESEVIERVRTLKKRNVVRQIGAIFDTRRLGYRSVLVAMRFSPEQLHRGAQIINRHPGVSHNYARDGKFNLWFTLAVPPDRTVESEVAMLARAAGAEATRLLPTVRFFKIGVNFDMEREVSDARTYFVPDGPAVQQAGEASNGSPALNPTPEGWNKPQPLSDRDVCVIRELQEDIDLVPRPFDAMAARLGMSVQELFAYAAGLVARRLMRRYSAVLYHRKAGFSANAMIVWKVPEERAQEVGGQMAKSPWVTHCYQRPTYEDWPYTHFTMIHATSREKCEEVAHEIEEATGIHDRLLLYSTREYKKTRVRYFVEDEFTAPEAALAAASA